MYTHVIGPLISVHIIILCIPKNVTIGYIIHTVPRENTRMYNEKLVNYHHTI